MRTFFRTFQAFILSFIIFTISLLPLNKVSSSPSVNQSIETAWVVWETGIPIQNLSQQTDELWAGGYVKHEIRSPRIAGLKSPLFLN